MFVLHQIANDLEYLHQPTDNELTLDQRIIQSNINHFMTAINLMIVMMALLLLEIHIVI
jgi:hypothetical protein